MTKQRGKEEKSVVSGSMGKNNQDGNEKYLLAAFTSTHDALALEKYSLQLGLEVVLIPVPRKISTSCGLAARFPLTGLLPLLSALDEGKVKVNRFYSLSEK